MNTAVPPGNCVTHGYHGLAACPRCSSSTLPAAPISAGQAHAAVSPFDLIREALAQPRALNDRVCKCPQCRDAARRLAALDQLQRDHEALAAERGEADVEHVERLERRIKEQRDHITRLMGMREPGDRYTRKRMAALERALGRVSLGEEKLKEDFAAYRARTDADLGAAVREAETLREALGAYESAVQDALRIAPNHWHEYRDPFELGPVIQKARSLGRAALASSRDTTETT